MSKTKKALMLVLAYVFAGAGGLTVYRWPHFDGHVHIPFSDFPECLVWAPIAPLLLLSNLPESIWALAAFAVLFAALGWLLGRRP